MTFSEPLDPSSHLEVTDQCGRVVSGDTEVAVDEMSTNLTRKPKGHYTVDWTATGLAGASGTSEGSFAFHVYQGEPCDPDRGKGNHNHHNNEGPKNNNNHHGGNKKHRGGHGNGPGGDHNGSPGNEDHSSTTHSSTEHTSDTHAGSGEGDHSGAGGHQGRSRHGDHGKGKGSGHDKHQGRAGERPNKQSDPDGRSVADKPTGATDNDALNLLLVLLLPALLGTTGGVVLRARIA